MPYSVIYTSKGIAKYKSRSRKTMIKRLLVIASVGFICILLCFATARNWLLHIFFPGDHGVTKEAATQMITDIKEGQSVGDAVTAFCQEILKHDIH